MRDPGNQLAESSSFARLRWERITEILSTASEMPPESRLTYIARACGSDASVRGEVERLFRELEDMSGFLEQPPGLPHAPREVQPGSRLGPYQLCEKIGEGGMGIVFEAIDTRLSRRIAIKLLRGTTLGGNSGRQRFFQEARMMASLNHSSVVTIYDVGTSGELDFIAMEYVDGKPLDTLLAELRLPAAKALAFARQVGSALSLAHSIGIVHRDLKPGNIIIGKDGVAKVLDFGLAKWTRARGASAAGGAPAASVSSPILSDLTMQGDIMGTVAYMSPEQAAGDGVDERSDVFSFGAVLYEMLSGRKAFGRSTQNEVLRAIATEQPPGLRHASPSVPHRIEKLIFSCLRKNPAERPTMAAVIAELESTVRGSGRIKGWIAAAAVSLAAFALALWTSSGARDPEPVQLLSRPITAYPGDEIGPSFSPDGTRIAFAWKRPETKRFEVYTRALEGGVPKPLVAGSSSGHHPVWSPSGKEIAFVNEVNGVSSIFIAPSQGGVPREIASAGLTAYILSPSLAWSEDSRWIAYTGVDRATGATCIFAIAPETGLVHKLTQPKPGEKHEQPALSRDGKLLAFTIDRDGVSNIGFVKLKPGMLPDAEAREVHFPGLKTKICSSPLWRPANGELIFEVNNGAALSQLWSIRVDADGAVISAPRLIGNLGGGAVTPALSRTGKRLAFSRHISNEDLYVVDLTPGNSGAWRPLLASAERKSWPRYSPDGRRIAFESDRGGFAEVWLADADGSAAFALTNFHGPVTGSPAWSPDGQQIAFDSRATGEPQVYTIRTQRGAQPRPLTSGTGFLPAWSADGRFLYFVSNRTGVSNIWRVPAEAGEAIQISQRYGFDPQPSPDGKYVYFFAGRSQHAPIHRIDLTTLREEPLIEDAMDRSLSVTAHGLYYLRRGTDESITLRLFEPARNRDSALTVFPQYLNGGLDVSKDGRTALIVSSEYVTTDLMVVEDLP